MNSDDFLDQAIDRIQHLVREEPDRRVSFLLGSGVSLPAIPSTSQMMQFFCDELGQTGERLRLSLASESPATGYQRAARELKQRRGDTGLANAIRKAVKAALPAESNVEGSDMDSVPDGDWNVPPSQLALGKLVRCLPSQRRGPIYTTNFDPLTEVSLRRAGVDATTVAVPAAQAFPLDGLIGATPVVHLHGFWLKTATLSTAAQLDRARPGIESMIQAQLARTTLVVLGYGGWNDSFTRALSANVRDGRFSSLESEVLWIGHGPRPIGNALLETLGGSPGVDEYWGVDAATLLEEALIRIGKFDIQDRDAYLGWSAVPRFSEVQISSQEELIRFTEGIQPTWREALTLPRLAAIDSALLAVEQKLLSNEDSVVTLMGPTGEGKSLGLQQIGMQIASRHEGVVCLYREVDAPPLTKEWLDELRRRATITLVVVDEADLMLDSISGNSFSVVHSGGKIIWLLALHGHYETQLRRAMTTSGLALTVVPVNEISFGDSIKIAQAWIERELLPAKYLNASADDVATLIRESANTVHGDSLFGAVLHLWVGDQLVDRARDLLGRLAGASIFDRSLREALLAIAIVQTAWDVEEQRGLGLSLRALGLFCGVVHEDVVPLIVSPLGREAGIAQVGDRVYVRHPSIARVLCAIAQESDEYMALVRKIGALGGRMRRNSWGNSQDVRPAYLLYSRLTGPAAFAAAFGAIEGAGRMLEPRVSYMATARKAGRAELAQRYGAQLQPELLKFIDRRESERGYWVERAVNENGLGHADLGIAFSLRALIDLNGAYLDVDRATYALVTLAVSSQKIVNRRLASGSAINAAAMDLLVLVPGAENKYRPIAKHPRSPKGPLALVGRLREESLPFMKGVSAPGEMQFRLLTQVISQCYADPYNEVRHTS